MDSVHSDADAVADLLSSPKARRALAWLAAAPGSEQPCDPFSAAEVNLKRTRLAALRENPAGLLAAVHDAVEDWRYHPHAQLASDEHAEGYRPIATALRRAPAAAWWWAELDRAAQTWIYRGRPLRSAVGMPFVTNFGHRWDATMPAEAVVTSPRLPRLPAALLLSDLTNPPYRRPRSETLSAWDVPIKPEAQIYTVHSPADWVTLVDRYSTPRSTPRTNLCQSPPLTRAWAPSEQICSPDWAVVSQHYTGVYLSPAGWLTATSRVLSIPGARTRYTFCEGWPSTSCVWFRPLFEQFNPITDVRLEFGYGRPATGARLDLAAAPAVARPWWKRWWPSRDRGQRDCSL
jgi:hypothetical protein